MTRPNTAPIEPSESIARIVQARHHDPFEVLGRHLDADNVRVRAFLPGASEVLIEENGARMTRLPDTDLFEWEGPADSLPERYRLRWIDEDGIESVDYDPYCFAPIVGELDLHLFREGRHLHAYRFLGAHPRVVDGVAGIGFSVWAPNAERVSVIGDWNHWDGRRHPMRARGDSGVWELFLPGVAERCYYKFELRARGGHILVKTDPYGRRFERRPGTAAMVCADSRHAWSDHAWMSGRRTRDWLRQPLSIYEVHLGSWRRDGQGQFLDYRTLAHQLVDYIKPLGFTHIELLPVTEHPLDASWGYQTTGYFAPTSRFGTPDDFRYFVDHCHCNGIGVLLDWAPGHFPRDETALARFDGTALYEHADPRRGEHRDWGTYIFNYGRNEVRNFLIASAIYWLEEMHIDGLRVDAVASMLYLDYSRGEGDWIPNQYGGRENLEALQFIRHLNEVTHREQPGTFVIAEESTAWPQVTRPVDVGGLGFSMKWNMGWMHDTLLYMRKDPVHRRYHHNELTFGLLYAFNENFVLPFSHDEVVHGKGSMLDKMPGDCWQRFANLRLLYTYLFTYPGKKLMFMGGEFAQYAEWNFDASLDWHLASDPRHKGMQQLVGDLNALHRDEAALHRLDFDNAGFQWIDCNDASNSLLSYARYGDGETVVVALNFTPVPREGFRLGVPQAGRYRLLLNSDSEYYAGSNLHVPPEVTSEPVPWMGKTDSITLNLPPLGGVVFKRVP